MKKDFFNFFMFFSVCICIFFSCKGNGKIGEKNSPLPENVRIVFSSQGEGSVSAKCGSKNIESGTEVKRGSKVVFTAEALEKFSVGSWIKNGTEEISLKGKTKISFTAENDLDISVNFTRMTKRINFSSNAGGALSAEINGAAVKSGSFYEIDSEVIFKAVPKEGYKISAWEVNKNQLENGENKKEYSAKLTDNISVKVIFEKLKFQVNFFAEGSGKITASAGSKQIKDGDSVEFERTVSFTAEPDDKAEIDSWVLNGKVFGEAKKKKKVSIQIKEKTEIKVIFKAKDK